MPLTLAEALQTLPILSSAQVIAGGKGLQRVVRWTHIVDHAEVLSWVRSGDLLLTTAFALKDNPHSELVMVERLSEKGLAGMLVSIGRYIREIPHETIAAAEVLDFPIITIPWEVPLVEVTHAIHERIIREQYALNEQLYHIHQVLSQLVLEGGGLQALAERLSELLTCSVTIEDSALQLQAYTSIEPIDEARRRSIREGATPKELADYLASSGLFQQLQEKPQPQRVPPNPAMGMTLERIIAPILVGKDLYGYLWIIASQRTLTDLDFFAIERAAHIAALILSREQSVYAAEQRVKARLFENLMDPSTPRNPYELADMLKQFGLHGEYRVLILENRPPNAAHMPQLARLLEKTITDLGMHGSVLEWAQRLIVILATSGEADLASMTEALQQGTFKGYHLLVGISSVANDASQVRQAYQQAIDALQAGAALGKGAPGAWHYADLGYLPWLHNLPQEMRSANRYLSLVKTIAAHDQHNNSQYLKTLESYLEHSQNSSVTAQTLFIHRNTLLKRLVRMQELWQLDLVDPTFVLNLQIALKDWVLNQPA